MRRSPETLIKAWFGDSGRAVLLLCALSFPVVATAGVTSLCDTRTVDTADFDISTDELTIDLVDLGSQGSIELDITIEEMPIPRPTPPNVDEMLKQMFDRSHSRDGEPVREQSQARNLPIVDLSAPVIRTETPELVDDTETSGTERSNNAAPAVNARVPGLTDDELRRYRRKMYRTDI